MKAISIWPEYTAEICRGEKEVEFRSWKTDYRGPLLICSTKAHGVPFSIPGHAVCVVDLVDIKKAGGGEYAWILENLSLIEPFPVKGKLSLFEVDDNLIKYPPVIETEEEWIDWLDEYFNPKMVYVEQHEDGLWYPTEEAIKKFYSEPEE